MLGIHWKIVKNRMLKMEEFTAISLDDSEEALDVHVSLKILRF
ncbi:hypothetical protein [Lentibacillus songyuanensis]